MKLSPIRRTQDDDTGTELIEFIGTAPLIIIVALIVWQFMAFAHCAVLTQNAARECARAKATYETSGRIATNIWATAGAFNPKWSGSSCSGEGQMVRCTVTTDIPIIDIPFIPIPDIQMRSTGVARCEEPW